MDVYVVSKYVNDVKDAAASMNLTRRQGDRLWAYARAWLYDRLRKA